MTVLFDVFALSRSVTRLLDDALVDVDLNGFDYAMTSMLRDQGRVSPTDIATWTGMTPTTVSGVLRRLQDRGYVDREPHPEDGRSSLATLTAAGTAATEAAQAAFDRARRDVEAALGERLGPVRTCLQDLDDAVRAAANGDRRPWRVAPVGSVDPDLTPAQADELARYVAWLRHRDASD